MTATTEAVPKRHLAGDGREPVQEAGEAVSKGVRVGRGFAWAAGGRIGAYLAALVSGPLVARMLTPDSLGDYFLAMTIASVGSLIALMGLSGVAMREVSAAVSVGRNERARAAIVATVLLACLSGAATAGLLISPAGRLLATKVLHSPRLDEFMPLVAAWTVLLMLGTLANHIWRGLGSIRLAIVLSDFAPKALFAVGVAALWLTSRHVGVETILWLWLAVLGALLAIWAVALGPRVASLPTGPNLAHRALISAGLGILVTGIMWQAMDQVDLVILANTAPRHDVALYGAAGRISLLLAVPLFLVEFVVAPFVAGLHARGETEALELLLRRSATIAMLPTALGAIAVVGAGRWILEGLYGSYYGKAWPVLTALAVGDLAFVLTGSCGLALWITGHQRSTARVATGFAIATLSAAICTVRVFGMVGLAVTMGVGIAAQNVVLLVLAKRRLGVWTHAHLSPRGIVESMAFAVHGAALTPYMPAGPTSPSTDPTS